MGVGVGSGAGGAGVGGPAQKKQVQVLMRPLASALSIVPASAALNQRKSRAASRLLVRPLYSAHAAPAQGCASACYQAAHARCGPGLTQELSRSPLLAATGS